MEKIEKEEWNFRKFKETYNSLARNLSVCKLTKDASEDFFKEKYLKGNSNDLKSFAREIIAFEQEF